MPPAGSDPRRAIARLAAAVLVADGRVTGTEIERVTSGLEET